ncbi:MAG TPA: preprotein translocase subunit SecG [Candidatus Parcubacteria bacterium]|jgi:protein translocase SecG subunit|nr:preprotein translocase subunit SecG [Candidatus Parcubacteria bacterium]|tara:strand:- start:781 stop:1005 length:225 start_codon:yes stop_codon:yes gene_type:complete
MSILYLAQIIVSILLIIFILVQQRGTALGSAFGGSDSGGGEFYGTLRGVQEKIFWATVVLGALFVILSLLNLVF